MRWLMTAGLALFLFCGQSPAADFLDELTDVLDGGSIGREADLPFLQWSADGLAEPAAAEDAAAPQPEVGTVTEQEQPASGITRMGIGLFPELRIRITASKHTIISSQTTGKIVEITVRDGDHFDAGDLLVRLDDSLILLQRDRADAVLERARRLYQVNRELADMNTKGEAEVDVARLDMEQARVDRQMVDLVLDRTHVTAPFSGRVAEVYAREQQYIAEGAPLLEILDDQTLELEFIVPSQWVRWFRPGFAFDVTVEETGGVYRAVLDRLGGKVDPLSQSLQAYAVLEQQTNDLMEGMSGIARITPPGDMNK